MQYFREHRKEILTDLDSLVRIPSVARAGSGEPGMPYGREARMVLAEAEKIAGRLGFFTVIHDDACLTAEPAAGRDAKLCLLAHLDVVEAGEGWTKPPYELTEENGKIFGRGIADNKGPAVMLLHAMKAAMEICPDLPYSPRIWLGTAEEIGSPDLKIYQKKTKLPPLCLTPDSLEPVVIGECAKHRPEFYARWKQNSTVPSVSALEGGRVRNAVPGFARARVDGIDQKIAEDAAAQAQRQYGAGFTVEKTADGEGVDIRTVGRGAHIGWPEKGVNAQTALIGMLARLPLADCPQTRAVQALDRLFPHGDLTGRRLGLDLHDDTGRGSSVNFTVCHMTETEIRCKLDARGPLNASPANFQKIIDHALEAAGFQVVPSEMEPAHYTHETVPLVQTVKKVYEQYLGCPVTCRTSLGASYAYYIAGAVSTGPAFPGTDTRLHRTDEFMYISDLMRLGEIYTELILKLCDRD